jgi:hypothetical protein
MISYPDCVACGGSGTSSRGSQCVPCQARRHRLGEGSADSAATERRRASTIEAKKAELMGLLRMVKAQNEPDREPDLPHEETPEEKRQQEVERKRREMRRLLERMLS